MELELTVQWRMWQSFSLMYGMSEKRGNDEPWQLTLTRKRKYCFHGVTCQHQNWLPELGIKKQKHYSWDLTVVVKMTFTRHPGGQIQCIYSCLKKPRDIFHESKLQGKGSWRKGRSRKVPEEAVRTRCNSWESLQSKANKREVEGDDQTCGGGWISADMKRAEKKKWTVRDIMWIHPICRKWSASGEVRGDTLHMMVKVTASNLSSWEE